MRVLAIEPDEPEGTIELTLTAKQLRDLHKKVDLILSLIILINILSLLELNT